MEKINLPYLEQRDYQIDKAVVSTEDDRVVFMSISSELPVQRWWYEEILEHSEEAVDLARFKKGANLLFNHNKNDYLGVFVEANIVNKRLEVKCKFDLHDRAEQIYQSVINGILTNVSIGYEVKEMILEKQKTTEELDCYRVTKWCPLEGSIVTVPADYSVGVGRSLFQKKKDKIINNIKIKDMESSDRLIAEKSRIEERERIAAIRVLGEKYNLPELATFAIEEELSLIEARAKFLEKIPQQNSISAPLDPLGLDNKEKKDYRISRAIAYRMGWVSKKEAALEIEISEEIAKRTGKRSEGIFVPTNDLGGWSQRATYATGASGTGGATIETELMQDLFIDALRNRSTMVAMGATMLSGLEGNVDIPRQASVATVQWVAENAVIAQTESTFELVNLRPKTIAARSIYTRQMLLQSSIDIEVFIRNDLSQGIALGIDLAAISGTGVGSEPRGIINQVGVGSVILGVNGAIPTWANIVNMETVVATANTDQGTCHYLSNSKIRGRLKQTKDDPANGSWIWQNSEMGMGIVNGYEAYASNQIRGDLTKGTGTNLSLILFGDFSSVLIGEWGILELLPNPYGTGYESGNVQVRAMQTVDVAVRRPQHFCVISDAIA